MQPATPTAAALTEPKPKRVESIVSPLKEILKDFEVREVKGRKSYIGWGCSHYPDLSAATSGFRKGCLHLFAGSSRRSRPQILLELAISAIKTNKVPVLFLTYQATTRELLYQLVSRESGLDMETVHYKKIVGDVSRKDRLKAGLERLAKYQAYLHLVPGAASDNCVNLEKMVHELRATLKLRDVLVVIDSLQSFSRGNKSSLRELKALAMSLDVPLVVGSEITSAGEELDEKEGRDRVNLAHCCDFPDVRDVVDMGIPLTKNQMDSMELRKVLAKQAENLGKDTQRLPELEVVDLILEKLPYGSITAQTAVQILVSRQNGKVVELGVRHPEDILRFTRIEKSVVNLIERTEIEFYEAELGVAQVSAADAAAFAGQGVKVKPKIALRKD